jgi:hypothetical protein
LNIPDNPGAAASHAIPVPAAEEPASRPFTPEKPYFTATQDAKTGFRPGELQR